MVERWAKPVVKENRMQNDLWTDRGTRGRTDERTKGWMEGRLLVLVLPPPPLSYLLEF